MLGRGEVSVVGFWEDTRLPRCLTSFAELVELLVGGYRTALPFTPGS